MQKRFCWLVLGVMALIPCQDAQAVIKADTPLSASEAAATYIILGKVEKFDAEKRTMMVSVIEDIKGKAPFRQMPINCKVDAPKENMIEPLLKRFGPDLEMMFFVTHPQPPRKNWITFGYSNGTWFQLIGTNQGKPDEFVFVLHSAEPYYRKSFKGTTEELRKVMKDHAVKKTPLPPLDKKVLPDLGPEYKAAPKSGRLRLLDIFHALNQPHILSSQGSLFAVIPTIGLGAPLAILALLFPTVFGGVFVLFRQWMAFIMLLSLNSTLIILHACLAGQFLRGSWWGTDAALWFLMTVFTLACAIWAWRRQLDFLYSGDEEAPQRTEQMVLLIMTASCVITTAVWWYAFKTGGTDIAWAMIVVMTVGIGAGTLWKFCPPLRRVSAFASPSLATEGIILGAMLVGHVFFAPAIWGGNLSTEGNSEVGDEKDNKPGKFVPVVKKWDMAIQVPGMFASAPLVHGDSVYAAYSETVTRTATLVRMDRRTGVKKWSFIGKNEDLIQMISTPCIADGKLYFGEGFHDDRNCKVYCVDAETGAEVWRFVTGGQTESSPAVANGKVYIGAGNNALHCLDAKTGAKIWKYPADNYNGRLLRFGGGMHVAGNRLYCGTGVDRNQTEDKGETATFCFDANTGKLLWKRSAPYPVWSTPIVKDRFLYVSSGNGDVLTDAEPPEVPGGAVQCLDAETGKEMWKVTFGNGILESPAIDAHHLYFGCRDKHVYCLRRADGKERWRRSLDSPIIGMPALDCDAKGERAFSLFVAATEGKVCCLNPRTGGIDWTYNLTQQKAYLSTTPQVLVERTAEGYRRHIYFGTGLGGGTQEQAANRPAFFCLEEQ